MTMNTSFWERGTGGDTMGVVIAHDADRRDKVNLRPPEGRSAGAEMAIEVHHYIDGLHSAARIKYMDDFMASSVQLSP